MFDTSWIKDVDEIETRDIDWAHVDVSLNNEICMLPHTMHRNLFANREAFDSKYLFQPLAHDLKRSIPRGKTVANLDSKGFFRVPGDEGSAPRS